MLVYPPAVYDAETHIVQTFPGAGFDRLRYWRLGITVDARHPMNRLSPFIGPPYSIIVAYAAVRIGGPLGRHIHRIAYINCGGFPNHVDGDDADYESDDLIEPSSFVAGKAETLPPKTFDLPIYGPLGTLKNEWRRQVGHWKSLWDQHYALLDRPYLRTSIERWGATYTEPTF